MGGKGGGGQTIYYPPWTSLIVNIIQIIEICSTFFYFSKQSNNHNFRGTDPSSRRTDEDYFIPVFNHSQASLLAKDSNLSVRYQTNGGSTPDLSTNTSGLAAAQQTFRSPAATPHMDRHVHKRHGDRRDRLKYDSLRRERQPGNVQQEGTMFFIFIQF